MHPFLKYNIKLKPETIEELGLTEFEWFWNYISYSQVLSEPFIEKYAKKLNWVWISWKQVLSESFTEKYAKKLNWVYISECQNLSLEFLIKHKNKIFLYSLKWNKKISQETKDKFLEK